VFKKAIEELVRVSGSRSLVDICAEYCLEGGSVELKGAVNAFIRAKVNVVETESQYTDALIGTAMDKLENADAVLVASVEELTKMLDGLKEMMKKLLVAGFLAAFAVFQSY
jgi:hypothetical protein